VPIFGDFKLDGGEIRFNGKRVPVIPTAEVPNPPAGEQASLGLALSSHSIGDGDISAEVEFEQVTNETFCQFAIAYDPNATHLVAAGIGGETFALFSIREFGSQRNAKGWWNYRAAGDRSILRQGSKHVVEARFRGALVTLSLNGVMVGTAEVSSPTGTPRQVGLICRSENAIVVRKFTVNAAKPRAFIVMQFGESFDDVYRDVVKEVCKAYEVTTIRADEVTGPGLIISDIIRQIAESQLIIADITPTTNPNVYFEVGYALALGKPTILLARKGTPLPFDVAAYRVLFYEDTIGGKNRLEDGLRRHLDAILGASPPSA
jgi:hypothetical protein